MLLAANIIFVLATLVFIWGNSLASVEESKETSTEVLEDVKPALETVVGEGKATDHLVRKLAHFTEFSALGIELALLLILLKRVRLQCIINCAFIGFAAAVTDETIQIFTGRGSQVQDVWLDFLGFCIGIILSLSIMKLAIIINAKRI